MIPDILNYISRTLLSGKREVHPDDDLLGSGIVDSVAMMRLVGFIEQEYEVQIPFEDITIENFTSVRAIAEYVEQRRAASSCP